MAAYVIYARCDEIDEGKSREYSKLVVPQIREFGGEVVTARGKVHVLEGQWQPKAITILKFENQQALMRWYQSYEYAPLKQMRLESNIGDFIVPNAVRAFRFLRQPSRPKPPMPGYLKQRGAALQLVLLATSSD